MLASYNLLNEFVDLSDITPEELADRLTFSGFEVEGVEKLAYADKLVIGHVLTCEPHPDSDHLHVLKVDCGQEGVLDIVCGAPNVCKDARVIVALVGCNLPALGETIKAGVIRGCVSNGMCCSLVELGVDKSVLDESETKGIHLLPEDAPVGERNVLKYLGLDDTVYDINVLANRPDCLSIIGLAREIACLLNRPMRELDKIDFKSKETDFDIEIKSEHCDEFEFVEVKNIENKKTPSKIVSYLNACGIRSVSLLVDIGNFAMLLTGQPFHMYDLDKVEGRKLVIEEGKNCELLALDGNKYQATENDIVISDSVKPVCLAGVMGLKNVEVDSNTTRIGIEAAHFYHATIRHTTKRLGLASDSSALFIKGTNPYTVDESINTLLVILNRVFGNEEIVGYKEVNKVAPLNPKFDFSVAKLNHRLGSDFTDEEVYGLIDRLGLKHDETSVYTSKYRLDLVEQCDIEEEVFRYNDPSRCHKTIDNLPQTLGSYTENQLKLLKIRRELVALGYSQIQSYTLLSEKLDRSFRVFDDNESYRIKNPMTNDHEFVRSDILSSMISTINYNLDRKNDDLAFFEISTVERPEGNKVYLSLGLANLVHTRGLLETHKADFYDLKGAIVSVLNLLGLDSRRYSLVRTKNENFHLGRAADILIGRNKVGTFGEVHPKYKMGNVIVGELDMTTLLAQRCSKLKCAPLSSLQPLRRDLAFNLIDTSISAESIIKEIKHAGGKDVAKVEVFDEYIKDDNRSLAFSITLKREGKSFTDVEINSLLNNIVLNVTKKLNVELKR